MEWYFTDDKDMQDLFGILTLKFLVGLSEGDADSHSADALIVSAGSRTYAAKTPFFP